MKAWILIALVVRAVRGCPKDVMSGVHECMEPLESRSVGQGQILEFMSSLDKTTQLCREGKIQRSFSCLNDLYNNCARHKGSDHKLDIGVLVNMGKWREAMDNICNNIDFFNNNAECEKNASLEYAPCAQAQVEWANQKYSVINNPRRVIQHQKMDEALKIACDLNAKILDCLKKPFKKFCPDKLTDFLVDTVESFRPPACARRSLTKGSNGHINVVDISISTSEIKPPTSGNSKPGEHHGSRDAKYSKLATRFDKNSSPMLKAYSGNAFLGIFVVTLLVII